MGYCARGWISEGAESLDGRAESSGVAGLGSPFRESSPVAGGPRQLPSEFLKAQPAGSGLRRPCLWV